MREIDPAKVKTTKGIDQLETTDEIIDRLRKNGAEMVGDGDGLPARSVRIDLHQVEGAAFYEVMVIPAKKHWVEPMTMVVPAGKPQVRLRLSPGLYSIRTRSLDENKEPGGWGPYENFWVRFRPILGAYPAEGDKIEALSDRDASIIFEWPKVEDARFYFFRLRDSSGKSLRMAITANSYLRSNVDVNAKYSWSVVPLSESEEYQTLMGEEAEALYTAFEVLPPSTDGRGTIVTIQTNPKAVRYQYEVVGIGHDDEPGAPQIFESTEGAKRFILPSGEYEVRARSIFEDSGYSDWSAPSRFFVKRLHPDLITPIRKAEVEPTDDDKSKVRLIWKDDVDADIYHVFVFDQEGKTVIDQKVQHSNVLEVYLPHNQTYKWAVRAYSKREIASEEVTADKAEGQFSIDRFIYQDLTVAEEPSQLYGYVRQLASLETYEGQNYDQNAIVHQQIFASETEAALGYWGHHGRFGAMAHVSLSGFDFRNQFHPYGNAGIDFGYRHLYPQGDRLRVWAGVSYRQRQEILTNPFTTSVDVSTLSSLGPQVQVSYNHVFDDKWGLLANATVYYSQIGFGSPDGTSQIPTLSYRAGILGSYEWSKKIHLLAGYYYRYEQSRYYSGDTPGAVNTSATSGNYLSFMIEFGLAEKRK